eukprot:gene443-378_t
MLQRRAIVFALGALVTRELQGATEEFSASAVRVPKPTRRFTVDLDEAPRDRWRKVYSDPLFANATAEIQEYFDTVVPIKQAVPILETIAGDMERFFPPDVAEEMTGISEALDANLGTVILINLVYQLEGIGYDCLKANVTGPCPTQQEHARAAPNLCTSIVAAGSDGKMHGRNMDWNLDQHLLKYVISADFVRGGKKVFTGTFIAGMVGLLHGLSASGYSASMNARDD